MELALYNGALSGLSLDGEHFFYDNPLASRGEHRRWTWHRCPCCPPNIGRLIASLGQYVYSSRAERSGGSSLHCRACAAVCRRRERLAQPDRRNILGKVRSGSGLTRNAQPNSRFVCASPAGARFARLQVNGVEVDLDPMMDRGYAHVSRRWQKGDEVTLFLDMPADRVYAHPGGLGRYRSRRAQARTDRLLPRRERQRRARASDRVAAVQPHRSTVRQRSYCRGSACLAQRRLPFGRWEDGALYRTDPPTAEPTTIQAIPYSFWSNRDPDGDERLDTRGVTALFGSQAARRERHNQGEDKCATGSGGSGGCKAFGSRSRIGLIIATQGPAPPRLNTDDRRHHQERHDRCRASPRRRRFSV